MQSSPTPFQQKIFMAFGFGILGILLISALSALFQPSLTIPFLLRANHKETPILSRSFTTPALVPPLIITQVSAPSLPIGAVIDNLDRALPQHGLTAASHIWELYTEGGITRIFAVFPHDALPEKIGPIRSARVYFNFLASIYGGFYMHSGGNEDALKQLTHPHPSFLDINEFANQAVYFRDTKRDAPHNLFTDAARIEAYRTAHTNELPQSPNSLRYLASNRPQFELGTPIRSVSFSYKKQNTTTFLPDGDFFIKQQDAVTWVDAYTKPYRFSSVVLLTATERPAPDPFTPDSREYDFDAGGTATILRGGYAVNGTWERKGSTLSFTDMRTHTPLALSATNTLFFVIPHNQADNLSITPSRIPRPLTIPILMYHYISQPPTSTSAVRRGLSVDPDQFEKQMNFLHDMHFTPVFFSDVLAALEPYGSPSYRPLPEHPIVLTFDDGYRDFIEFAFPILKRLAMHSVIALPVKYQNGDEHLTKEHIHSLDASGQVEFISHSLHHIDLTDMKYSEHKLREEIFGSREELSRLVQHTAPVFVYPFGNYNDTTISLVEDAGYRAAVTTDPGSTITDETLYRIPRIRIDGNDSLEQFQQKLKPFIPTP